MSNCSKSAPQIHMNIQAFNLILISGLITHQRYPIHSVLDLHMSMLRLGFLVAGLVSLVFPLRHCQFLT